MKPIYLDNASTTAVRPEVISVMTDLMLNNWGNPSSTHSLGRNAKSALELSRKNIAKLIGASSNEIIFTSGATEAIHWIIKGCVEKYAIKRVITSKIEHHAVLDTVLGLNNVQIDFVSVDDNGVVILDDLCDLLFENIPTLVCLMHVNNEIGGINDIVSIGNICHNHDALFMTDAVQAMGKFVFDLQQLPIDFLISSAHKFHGPKGIGFLFKRKNINLTVLFEGGGQEKGLRAGTENLPAIVGMETALTLAYQNIDKDALYIKQLKQYAIDQLKIHFVDVHVNGDFSHTSSRILNISLPLNESISGMLVFMLDMKGIAVSRGSACQSGSSKPSHVLQEILPENWVNKPNIRISFDYNNTFDDIDNLVKALKEIK